MVREVSRKFNSVQKILSKSNAAHVTSASEGAVTDKDWKL